MNQEDQIESWVTHDSPDNINCSSQEALLTNLTPLTDTAVTDVTLTDTAVTDTAVTDTAVTNTVTNTVITDSAMTNFHVVL